MFELAKRKVYHNHFFKCGYIKYSNKITYALPFWALYFIRYYLQEKLIIETKLKIVVINTIFILQISDFNSLSNYKQTCLDHFEEEIMRQT